MGHIQDLRNERCLRAFEQEKDPSDIRQDYFIDDHGVALGFRIERFNGGVLEYDGTENQYLDRKAGETLAERFPEVAQVLRSRGLIIMSSCNIESLPANISFDASTVDEATHLMSKWYAQASQQADKSKPFFANMNLIDMRQIPDQEKSIFFSVHLDEPAMTQEQARTQLAWHLAQEYKCNYFFCAEEPTGPRKKEPSSIITMTDDGHSHYAQVYDQATPTQNQLNNFLSRYDCMCLPYDTYMAIALEKTQAHNLSQQPKHQSLNDLVSSAEQKKTSNPQPAKKDLPPITR